MKQEKRKTNSNEYRQWDYCPRQWYLFKTTGRKIRCQASKRGLEFHHRQAQSVQAVQNTQSFLMKIIITGGIVCLFWLLLQLR